VKPKPIPVPICPSCGREAKNPNPGYIETFFKCGWCVADGHNIWFWGVIHPLAAKNVKKVVPCWRRDQYGWPIEWITNRPVLSFFRIIVHNLRKVIG
jgi:hypothetical protein